jgi:hypothetical protein
MIEPALRSKLSIGSHVKNNLRYDSREELSRRILILDFVTFRVENATSQAQMVPNSYRISREKFQSLGKYS